MIRSHRLSLSRHCLVLAAALVLAGCATEPTPTPATFFFPQHANPLGTGHLARLDGVMLYEDQCLWVQPAPGERVLVLWPSDVILGNINNHPAILDPDRVLLVEAGSGATLGGSSVNLETAIQLVGPIPDRCAGDSFWEASTADSLGGGPVLEAPDSMLPAAGICDDPQPGRIATFTIASDTPQPRCGKVLAEQRLRLVNGTSAPITVTFAGSDYLLEPSAERTFDLPFGGIWLPGVHTVHTSLYGGSGPAVWLGADDG